MSSLPYMLQYFPNGGPPVSGKGGGGERKGREGRERGEVFNRVSDLWLFILGPGVTLGRPMF